MWGDAQTAVELDTEHALADLLFQTTGPASIPLHDSRWQQLMLQYEILVHLDPQSNTLTQTACDAMARHAVSSSNLAALTLHASRMLNDLKESAFASPHYMSLRSTATAATSATTANPNQTHSDAAPLKSFEHSEYETQLLGKVRATCGVLNLLRILAHATIDSCCYQATSNNKSHSNKKSTIYPSSASAAIQEAFVYRDNGTSGISTQSRSRDAATELLYALIPFISIIDPPTQFYDATVFALSLLLVLLSTQLYQPMISSLQIKHNIKSSNSSSNSPLKLVQNHGCNFFLDKIMCEIHMQKKHHYYHDNTVQYQNWAQSILSFIIHCIIKRPRPPQNTIAAYYSQMVKSIIDSRGEKISPDGMYENHVIVHANAHPSNNSEYNPYQSSSTNHSSNSRKASDEKSETGNHQFTLASTSKRGITKVISVSSTILLLPFRLVRLAMSTIGLFGDNQSLDANKLKIGILGKNNAIWLSDSAVTDLGCSIMLLLTNNYRSNTNDELLSNPFKTELSLLRDNRWEVREATGTQGFSQFTQSHVNHHYNQHIETVDLIPDSTDSALTVNFESLFEAFGSTLHNEMGALLLYTLLQSSTAFAASVAARSDLDKLVLPLLRTLYFSSSLNPIPPLNTTKNKTQDVQGNQQQLSSDATSHKPYRSQSQLYVVMILLLLISQDLSFGPDAFRRVVVPNVLWYKERNLRGISLGSIVILSLLRSITYNLNRMNDGFLISNCCAVLLNLSPHIVNLHTYAAMRLASVTAFCCKRYSLLLKRNKGQNKENDLSTILGMYGETSKTLLQLLRHCLRKEVIEKNLHLLYSLIYHETDINDALKIEPCPFKKSDVDKILSIIQHASSCINDTENTLTVAHAMDILHRSIQTIMSLPSDSDDNSSEGNALDEKSHNSELEPDFSFTYEEEADPEVFFVPYVWEVIVCVITASSLEWSRTHIQVSPSMIVCPEEEETLIDKKDPSFSNDVTDVV